jgi:hypothetical protein
MPTQSLTIQVRFRREGGQELPLLLCRFGDPVLAIASSPHRGGIGLRRWVLNAQVPASYGRRDPNHHPAKLGVSLACPGGAWEC